MADPAPFHEAPPDMIIECPGCGARAKLPDSKEGAKVRCAECERIYLARPRGAGQTSARSQSSPAMPIGIGAAVIALVMILVMVANKNEGTVVALPEAVEEAPEGVVDLVGWDSKLVKLTRSFHDLAFQQNEYDLKQSLAMPYVWARLQSTDEEQVDPAGFSSLTAGEIADLKEEVISALVSDDPENLVGSWKPVDGKIVDETDDTAIIHLELGPRSDDVGIGSRNIEWMLVKDGGTWKAWSWERWFSDAELKSGRVARARKIERRTLSDGSEVIEGKPGPIPYMDSTPEAERKRIDGLIVKLIDLELPGRELNKVKAELRLVGKDAIPALLTRFYEMNLVGFEDIDSAIQAQLVHEILGDITGYITTFKAHEALGATEERRDSGVRQWFGWYFRKFERFEGRDLEDEKDLLEEAIEFKTEAERREYEKYKLLQEQEEQDQTKR